MATVHQMLPREPSKKKLQAEVKRLKLSYMLSVSINIFLALCCLGAILR